MYYFEENSVRPRIFVFGTSFDGSGLPSSTIVETLAQTTATLYDYPNTSVIWKRLIRVTEWDRVCNRHDDDESAKARRSTVREVFVLENIKG